ncbi:competence type IV pilus minor pilin ComGD [Pseudoneobacillus sp. C159]
MNNQGYSLIESLLVLSIVFVLASVTVILLNPNKTLLDHHLFLTQFQSDFYLAQLTAISHQQEVTVVFENPTKRYYFRRRYEDTTFIERKYPKDVSVMMGSMPLTFKILPDGNVNKFGTLFIKINRKDYWITFLLGKGRFYIVEI